MRKYAIIALAVGITFSFCGCEKLKGIRETQPSAPAETVAAAPTAESSAKEPFRPPTKEEYYRMLRSGYRPPRHAVSGEGYTPTGTTPGERRAISEAEGYELKVKFGEGRKYAASGRGDEPEAPSYVEHDDEGTYPPREFKGDD
jgi:hypothetical protein